MALLEWQDDYLTGIRVIDKDHKNLFHTVNTLNDSHLNGDSNESIGWAINTLIKYVAEHFEREERFLEQAGYPNIDEHRDRHSQFTNIIVSLASLYNQQPESIDVSKVLTFLGDWLKSHILKSDMHYIPYLKGEKQGRPQTPASQSNTQEKVLVPLTVTADKADLMRTLGAALTSGGKNADDLEKVIRTHLLEIEKNNLSKARDLFGRTE